MSMLRRLILRCLFRSWAWLICWIGLGGLSSAPSYGQASGVTEESSSQKKQNADATDAAAKKADPDLSAVIGGFSLRSIGPAMTGGRIVDLAVHPEDCRHFYVATASGGVWKTTNAGTTWTPLFDGQDSYSIGCITMDPKDANVIWVGTGENNSQRSVSYGDGVYKSLDGGRSWKNVGLKTSEHIGKIVVDPRDSDVVYVAAQGPLWASGGERGLYRTTDGGQNWSRILDISKHTGINEVVQQPGNPEVMLASAYQRARRVWTLINGGPESAIYKSTDGGDNWRKVTRGLPGGDLGRIGLAFAPSAPETVYALVEAASGGGVYKSTDAGETWTKQNDFDVQGQYYGEIFVDPNDANRIFVPNTYTMVSDDGGKTMRRLGESNKHVDTHVVWVDPDNPQHILSGCDGGLYETFDGAKSWRFINNLPITQFYDITVGNDGPFYHVYGGTQDNFSLGGPAKNRSVHGITNGDWFVCKGGDGFQCKVDPTDPNIIYCESQYGVLGRFNKRTGEMVNIQPLASENEAPLRWNWDSPLVLSPHKSTRLYFAAQRVFRSDDRGDSWTPISGDLTRQLNRDTLEIMGRTWPIDAVAKHLSTSPYGNIVALSESPLRQGLLYAGTDDGLIQVSTNDGKQWRKIASFPGVPKLAYVARLLASQHDAETVYAAFDHHKSGDFKPYLLRSPDLGQTWESIPGNLPERGSVLAIAEDPVRPDLLFVGTEFGLFVTLNGGKRWYPLQRGLPTIAVRDLAIQTQENDLVVGTFGRGFYVLDDYSPLRELGSKTLKAEAELFPVKPGLMYHRTAQYGGGGKAFQGSNFYTANNPAYGVTFTYYVKQSPKTKKQRRREQERRAVKAGKQPPIPTNAELRAEEEEQPPVVLLTIANSKGEAIRVLTGASRRGMHRVTWNYRETPAGLNSGRGVIVPPGKYQVSLSRRFGGKETPLAGPVEFAVRAYQLPGEKPSNHAARYVFAKQVEALAKEVYTLEETLKTLSEQLASMTKAAAVTPSVSAATRKQIRQLRAKVAGWQRKLGGDPLPGKYNRPRMPSLRDRLRYASVGGLSAPTDTQRQAYTTARAGIEGLLPKAQTALEKALPPLRQALDKAGAPWTPGR